MQIVNFIYERFLIKVKLFDNSTRDTGLSFIEYVTGSALVVI